MTLPLTSAHRRTARHFARLVRFCLDRHMPPADACALRLVFEHAGIDTLWQDHKSRILKESTRAMMRPCEILPEARILATLFGLDTLCGPRGLFLRAWCRDGQPLPLSLPPSPLWDDYRSRVLHAFRSTGKRRTAQGCRHFPARASQQSCEQRQATPKEDPANRECAAPAADFSRLVLRHVAASTAGLPDTDLELGELVSAGLAALDGSRLFAGHGFGTRVWVAERLLVPHLWLVGDVHGDLLAFEAILAHIDAQDPDRRDGIVLLGDLVDRGPYSAACLSLLLALACARPGLVLFMPGNHEMGLALCNGRFRSSVLPCDFAQWLDREQDHEDVRALGQACLHLAATGPHLLFLPGGIWAAHGGFPFRDLWPGLKNVQDLDSDRCRSDCVWGRFRPDVERRLVNRHTLSAEYGAGDLADWHEFLAKHMQTPVHTFIRGHDHVLQGIDLQRVHGRCAVVTCTGTGPCPGCVRLDGTGMVELFRIHRNGMEGMDGMNRGEGSGALLSETPTSPSAATAADCPA